MPAALHVLAALSGQDVPFSALTGRPCLGSAVWALRTTRRELRLANLVDLALRLAGEPPP